MSSIETPNKAKIVTLKTPDGTEQLLPRTIVEAVSGLQEKIDASETAAKAASRPITWMPTADNVGAISITQKGTANGVAPLGSDNKVPSTYLPSYVDDVLEYVNKAAFPPVGESGKIYVDIAAGLTWRWGGSVYTEISPSIALGETASTAYRGDRGKEAYEHSLVKNNPHGVTAEQLGAVPTTEKGVAGGVATLGGDGKVVAGQMPPLNYDPKGSAAAVQTSLTAHVNNDSNPHGVTAGQIGAVPASSIGYGTCSTASTTNAKAGALSGFALAVGAIVGIRFINGNTAAAATLNVNGTGAKPIYYCDAYVTSSMITAGMTAIFQYNGAQWVLLNPAVNGSSLFIIDITFDASFSGKAFTVNTNGFSYSGTVPGSLTAAVVASVPSALYTIACEGNTATVSTTNYFGVYPVTIICIPSFANATWTEVAAAVAADNVPASWKIGDTKDITLTGGEVLTIAIYGKKHDDLVGGGKAGITFGLKNLMAENRQMNTSNTNVGGFTGSAMYSWLQNDLYNSLPADLKTVIKSVNKKTSAGNQSSTINTNAMKVFLFSEVECFGTTTYSAAGEGAQYPIFTDNASRIKKQSNGAGSASYWWERSPTAGSAYTFCLVSRNGGAGHVSAYTAYGVCFGFCI